MFNTCCCTNNCLLVFDDFNRADSGTVGTGWTEVSGSWEIVSNQLKTASANALVSNSTLAPGINLSGYMSCKIYGSNSGDCLRIAINNPDPSPDEVYYIEIQVGAGAKLRLINSPSGVERIQYEIDITAAAATEHTLEVYHGNSRCYVILNGVALLNTVKNFTASSFTGLATGALTGDALFDDFRYELTEPFDFPDGGFNGCKIRPACAFFKCLQKPTFVSLTIANAVDNGGRTWSNLNGTYVLNFHQDCLFRITGLSLGVGIGTVSRIDFRVLGTGSYPNDIMTLEFLTDVSSGFLSILEDYYSANLSNKAAANPVTLAGQVDGVGYVGDWTVSYTCP